MDFSYVTFVWQVWMRKVTELYKEPTGSPSVAWGVLFIKGHLPGKKGRHFWKVSFRVNIFQWLNFYATITEFFDKQFTFYLDY